MISFPFPRLFVGSFGCHLVVFVKKFQGLAPVEKLPMSQRRSGAQVKTFDRRLGVEEDGVEQI